MHDCSARLGDIVEKERREKKDYYANAASLFSHMSFRFHVVSQLSDAAFYTRRKAHTLFVVEISGRSLSAQKHFCGKKMIMLFFESQSSGGEEEAFAN